MSSGVITGNTLKQNVIQRTLAPAQVSANTTSEQTFSVPGLQLLDFVEVSKPSHDQGCTIGNVRVSAANTLAITYINNTGAPITPATEAYLISVTRPAANTLSNGIGD